MSSRIFVAIRVKASPERAFRVFADEIVRWWRPDPLFAFVKGEAGRLSFKPGPHGRLVETLTDGRSFELSRVRVWSPPDRLFGSRQKSFPPDQETEVEVRFEPLGEETRVSVEHRGWDAIPQDHVARHGFPDSVFLTRHDSRWRRLLDGCGAMLPDSAE